MAAKKPTAPQPGDPVERTLYRLDDGTLVEQVPPGRWASVVVAAGHPMPPVVPADA